jgi:hypothetical protein
MIFELRKMPGGNKQQRKQSGFTPTHEDIEKAIQEFKNRGGKINKIETLEYNHSLKYRSEQAVTIFDFI